MRILLAGGGTGGHIMPIISIVQALKKQNKGLILFWLGEAGGPEEKAARQNQIPFYAIAAGKYRRYFSFWNVIDFFKIPVGIFQSFFLILGFKPDVVFSKGGYVSLPVVIAAFILRKKIIVHESDVALGLANRIAARLAKKVLLGFAALSQESEKYIFTGNPVREEILQDNREKAWQFFHLQEAQPVILVVGGSQGSRFINHLIVKALPKFKKYQIIHLTGIKNAPVIARSDPKERRSNLLNNEKYYHSYSYLDVVKMALAHSACDLVISRAGANTLAEIAVAGKPSILIPLPTSASGHQLANAKVFEKAGASIILEQKNLDAERLAREVEKLFADSGRMAKMGTRAKSLAKTDAGEIIAKEILGE